MGKTKTMIRRILQRYCLLMLFAVAALTGHGQKMSVESFERLDKDLTANIDPTIVYDGNGDKCALIKIQTTEHNFLFDVGSLGIVENIPQNSEHPGEIWLYVPHGVKSISIQHPLLGSINDYDLGMRVAKGKTYLLKLTSDQVNTIVIDYDNSQYLRVDVEPSSADLYINGMKQQVMNGVCEIPLAFGTHSYRVSAADYHPSEGQITINDKENKHELRVRLKQAFGYLTVDADDELHGADIYIDDTFVGKLPVENFSLKSGLHILTVSKKLYKPFSENFAMTDSGYITRRPTLEPNYADADITVINDRDAQIFDNGELLGTGKWKGRLEAGLHTIEAKKASHLTTSEKVEVENGRRVSYALEAPMPIYGSVEITTSPMGATVIIDGKNAGATPFINNKILVGSHSATLVKPGFRTETINFEAKEGDVSRHNIALTDYCTAEVHSSPNAWLSVDGKEVGLTPQKLNLVAGQYKIELTRHNYIGYTKTMRLDGNTEDINITLHRNYVRRNEFYFLAGYDVMTSSLQAGLGFYYHMVNFEASYNMAMKKSDELFITDNQDSYVPVPVTYKPWGIGIRAGYGLRIGSRIRFTPQVGARLTILTETQGMLDNTNDFSQPNVYYDNSIDGANAVSATGGARISVSLTPCIALSVTPEYAVGIIKSDGFKAVSDLSSKIKAHSDGFSCKVSLNLYF